MEKKQFVLSCSVCKNLRVRYTVRRELIDGVDDFVIANLIPTCYADSSVMIVDDLSEDHLKTVLGADVDRINNMAITDSGKRQQMSFTFVNKERERCPSFGYSDHLHPAVEFFLRHGYPLSESLTVNPKLGERHVN